MSRKQFIDVFQSYSVAKHSHDAWWWPTESPLNPTRCVIFDLHGFKWSADSLTECQNYLAVICQSSCSGLTQLFAVCSVLARGTLPTAYCELTLSQHYRQRHFVVKSSIEKETVRRYSANRDRQSLQQLEQKKHRYRIILNHIHNVCMLCATSHMHWFLMIFWNNCCILL